MGDGKTACRAEKTSGIILRDSYIYLMLKRLTVICVLLMNMALGQSDYIDSLKADLKRDLSPETELYNLREISWALSTMGHQDAILYAKKSVNRAKVIKDDREIGSSYIAMGNAYDNLSMYDSAIYYIEIAERIMERIGDMEGLTDAYNNLGVTWEAKGDLHKAYEYYLKSLEINRVIGDTLGAANSLLNIGVNFIYLEEPEKAKEYVEEALTLYETLKNDTYMSIAYGAMGYLEMLDSNYEAAIDYHSRALELYKEQDNYQGISNALINLGEVYAATGNIEQALDYERQSLQIMKVANDDYGLAQSYSKLGQMFIDKGEKRKGLMYMDSSLEISSRISLNNLVRDLHTAMSTTYEEIGDYKSSLYHLRQFLIIRDSLMSQEKVEAIADLEKKYETEKAKREREEARRLAEMKDLKLQEQDAEIRANRTILYGGFVVGFLLFGFAIFLVKRNRERKKANELLSEQKSVIEEKNKDIVDSINYAERIQRNIMPSKSRISELLPESFVIYKPKDIVSGDFYFVRESGGYVFAAVADCTGHGVPGAMVSVIGANGLNRAIGEHGLLDPAKILDHLREFVLNSFSESGDQMNDGMDIALVRIDQGKKEVTFAGANNPLWLVSKHNYDSLGKVMNEGTAFLHEIKADKQPIGAYAYPKPFTSHLISCNEGDRFYIFSDGYADQFGGGESSSGKGKKFKAANLKRAILKSAGQSMIEQMSCLDSTFEEWKGELEQLDDVCVMGVEL